MRSSRELDRAVNSRGGSARTYNPPIDVLLLCTANQCRSPMAEVLLRHHLAAAGIEATVSSAGLYEGGAPGHRATARPPWRTAASTSPPTGAVTSTPEMLMPPPTS